MDSDSDDPLESLLNGGDSRRASAPRTVSLEACIEAVGHGKFQRRLLLLTGATQMADAMELMIISFLGTEAACDFGLGDGQAALLKTSVFVGMLAGALGIGILSDRVGRRKGYAATVALVGGFGLLSAGAPGAAALALCRGFVGVGLGGASAALSLYAEFLPAERRGQRLLCFFLFFSFGGVVAALVAWATLDAEPLNLETIGLGRLAPWRLMLLASAAPSLLLCAVAAPGVLGQGGSWDFSPLPPSPRWLITTGQRRRVRALLEHVARINGTTGRLARAMEGKELRFNDEAAQADRAASVRALLPWPCSEGGRLGEPRGPRDSELGPSGGARDGRRSPSRGGRPGWGEGPGPGARPGRSVVDADDAGVARSSNAHAGLRRTTAALCALFLVMAVVYYCLVLLTVDLVRDARRSGSGSDHVDPCAPLNASEFFGVVWANAGELPGLLVSVAMIERTGRRGTVSVMFLACGIAMAALVVLTAVPGPRGASPAWLKIAVLFVARASALGFNQSLWVLSAESFPTTLRATGIGLVTSFARVGGMLSPLLALLYSGSPALALGACSALSVGSAAATWSLPEGAGPVSHDGRKTAGLRDTS
jgi:MFS family permease